MKNSESEQAGFYIQSDEDGDNDSIVGGDDGNVSDNSNYCDDNPQHQSKLPNSLNPSWPQSYRKSIDLYSNVPSPTLSFLGTPTLSRFGSSFLLSPLTKRHAPEILPSLSKPLLPQAQSQERLSSHSLLSPRQSSATRLSHYQKSSEASHELPLSRQSSFGQTVINGINALCGVGILSTPYAAKEGGWIGLLLLLVFGAICFYTGILLRYCMDSQSGLETYPDIGEAAFGTKGRLMISICLYVELYGCCVGFVIMQSDNLSSLFPNAHINLGGSILSANCLFAIIVTIIVLPTVWLRDMSILSYVSVGGVIASVLVPVCLFWVGLVDKVGFQVETTKAFNFSGFPVAIGLYGYCYSGHGIFPSIYTSMENRKQFPMALFASFGTCTVLYTTVAVTGYMMFGELTESQFTLNLPANLVASKVAMWTTIVIPFGKYALLISPVAMSLEELIPSKHMNHAYSILIRTSLVLSILVVAVTIPFFGLVMSLIGSLMTMLVTLILPCVCFLSILKGKVTKFQGSLCALIIAVGIMSSVIGTYMSSMKIIQQMF